MLREIKIENYKSILDDTIELGRMNVFIGANGSGKTNILEALAMVAASKDNDLNVEGLYNRGVRVTKPSLTFSSFIGSKSRDYIKVSFDIDVLEHNKELLNILKPESSRLRVSAEFYTEDANDIYSQWSDKSSEDFEAYLHDVVSSGFVEVGSLAEDFKMALDEFRERMKDTGIRNRRDGKSKEAFTRRMNNVLALIESELAKGDTITTVKSKIKGELYKDVRDFIIYTLNTQALRGIVSESKKQPLGINGEGLDILLANFNQAESESIQRYNYLISWLDNLVLDEKDAFKYKGHKLGRSTSILYFKDKFMRKNNNVFSAENANEGALHILFYLALFISKKTPQLFAIDNIETALNPRVCRTLVKELAQLAKENNKQALITTHNPAILDGLNLNDDEQRLFVVYRTDEGHTKTKRIKSKPKEGNMKLSELWMRGDLGGLPNDF